MKKILIKGAKLINEGKIIQADVLVDQGIIARIGSDISCPANCHIIEGEHKYLLPGVIDDQVHFREPGLTHKADLKTESQAAVAGGVTSFMEMPNTQPPTLTQELLEEKYALAAQKSSANYSFYMGTSNDNLSEVLKTDPANVCGIKIFMGSSTGNMLVDDQKTLEQVFSKAPLLIATHCEDEQTIRDNQSRYQNQYGEDIPVSNHPDIRSEEACYRSSSFASDLAQKYGARLHILHISTGKETHLFNNELPLNQKKITAEACIHHLWFSREDYQEKGTLIKWNPSVKNETDREQIWQALLDDRIDVIATDHAPHTLSEKQNKYLKAPSGGPLIQHSLVAMLEFYHQGKISLPKIVEKMCHNPAILYQIAQRGFIREGFWADLVLVDLDDPWEVKKENILYKCGWSPFEGQVFKSSVTHTIVSGELVWENDKINPTVRGKRLKFER
ncbi:MAG: dihydroorotase [Candidatus Cyclobacteriaceae bacterium M3_2C_046]